MWALFANVSEGMNNGTYNHTKQDDPLTIAKSRYT